MKKIKDGTYRAMRMDASGYIYGFLTTPKEYEVLQKELEGLGYDLKIIKRFRYKHQEVRMAMYD